MNFLAHFHLAWPDELRVLGGLEGDLLLPLLPELERSFEVFYPQLVEFSHRSVMLATAATENDHD